MKDNTNISSAIEGGWTSDSLTGGHYMIVIAIILAIVVLVYLYTNGYFANIISSGTSDIHSETFSLTAQHHY